MDTNSGWITEAARQALEQIRDAHGEFESLDARKRRHTVQRLAWALGVEGDTEDKFFEREKRRAASRRDKLIMARSTWWKHRESPDIKRALSECIRAAQAWRDDETQRAQMDAQKRIVLALAKNAEHAVVEGLLSLIHDASVRGDHRVQGIDRYIQLLSPDLASRIPAEAAAIPIRSDGELVLRWPEEAVKNEQ
jgi:hypothetical protein